LIDIRKAQIEYKNKYGVHAANFDELSRFLNEDKLPFVRKEGVLTDEQLEKGMTEKEAVKKGLIKRDTFGSLQKIHYSVMIMT
jgi:predicted RNA-binding protein associated with RNAse of E/G family